MTAEAFEVAGKMYACVQSVCLYFSMYFLIPFRIGPFVRVYEPVPKVTTNFKIGLLYALVSFDASGKWACEMKDL